jgi:hypothetical protein
MTEQNKFQRPKSTRRQKKSKLDKAGLVAIGVVVGIIGIIGLMVWEEFRPGLGTEIPMVRADHVPDGDPVESPSDPPTSGSHYGSPMPAGFYTTESPEYLSGDHDGYLIHSLEHGYIVFWYNCDLLSDTECESLLADITATMDKFNGHKLIAFPRPTISVPLVMTSWSYLLEMETYDARLAERFIKLNAPLAPEPNAQ